MNRAQTATLVAAEPTGQPVTRPSAPSPRSSSRARRRLLGHAVAYLALLVALLALTDLRVGWNLDDGAYATQVKVVEETGAWAYPYRHLDVDPDSTFAPVSHATVTDRGSYPYVKFPAWIEVLRASTSVFGDPVGWYVPAVLGAVVAAVTGGLLAARLSPASGPLGFWTVALGPLVVHTEAMWAHTMAAALGAAAALVVVELAAGRGRRWHPLALAAVVGALGAVRGEGPLFALAVAVTVGLVALARPGGLRSRVVQALAWGGPALAAGAVARLVSARWATAVGPGRIRPDRDVILTDVGYLPGRVSGAARTLLDGLGASHAGTVLAVLAMLLGIAAGMLLAGGAARRRDGWVVLGAAVVVVVVRTVVAPDDLGGLLVAVPLVPVVAGAWRWGRAPAPERALAVLIGLFGLAVLATQYPQGGSRDWGGRFLFPVLVPLAVLAVVTLRRLVATGSGRAPRAALVALVAVSAVPTAAGLRAAEVARASNRDLTDLTMALDVPTVVRVPRYLTRTSWRALPGSDWLSADPGTAHEALARLRPGRTEPVAVVGNGADQVYAAGYRREVRSPVVVIFTPR